MFEFALREYHSEFGPRKLKLLLYLEKDFAALNSAKYGPRVRIQYDSEEARWYSCKQYCHLSSCKSCPMKEQKCRIKHY
jgi:hypothetical protein